MKQTIQLCTAPDGVRLAWATVGSGPPLVKAANWMNHLENDWESPIWRRVLRELALDFRLVRYDERGNGLSDWDVPEISFEAFVSDLETVVDAAGLERFSLLGMSQGCAVSIAYAVRHPERVEKLVLYGGFAAGYTHGRPEVVARNEAMITLTEQGWGRDNPAYRQLFTSLFIPEANGEQRDWLNDLQRITTTPANAARILRALGRLDVRELLPRVQAPTLVLHARQDAVVPFGAGREIAAGIPGARFRTLESRNHILLEHEPAWERFLEEVRGFLLREVDAGSATSAPDLSRWLVTGGALAGSVGRDAAAAVAGADEPPAPPGLEPGAVLAGRYRVERAIGAGGMGAVVRARDLTLGRDVAVKAVAAPAGRWRERVLREARAVAALNHAHIATLYDVLEDGGLVELVMELVDGPSLAEVPPRSLGEAVAIARNVCDALEHAHRRGIVHRDLKPGNVLVVRGEHGPVAKLVDFGIALAAGDARLTGTGRLLGTPTYIAPEQVTGGEVGPCSDLYALGVMLYEWAAGAPPFADASPLAVVSQHVHAEPVPPCVRCPEVPPALEALILRLLAKQPAARPATAAEVGRELLGIGGLTTRVSSPGDAIGPV